MGTRRFARFCCLGAGGDGAIGGGGRNALVWWCHWVKSAGSERCGKTARGCRHGTVGSMVRRAVYRDAAVHAVSTADDAVGGGNMVGGRTCGGLADRAGRSGSGGTQSEMATVSLAWVFCRARHFGRADQAKTS